VITSKLPEIGTTIFTVMSGLAAEHGAINLGQGFPDFAVPGPLLDALARAIQGGHHQYPPMTGIAPLREAIARKTSRVYGHVPDPESEITVTSGATEALFNAIHALVGMGDEVIVLDPAYDSYAPAIALAGARAVHVPLNPDGFRPDWQRIHDAVTPRTRLLIINTPHNPTGAVLAADDIAALSELVDKTGLWLIADEVYEHIVFDGARHESLLRYPALRERAFVVSSFGKTYHCTGWKLGYCIAPAGLSAEFRKIHQYNTFCSFAPAQYAFADMLGTDPEHDQQLSAFYQLRRDRFRTQLAQTKLRPLPVRGGYFQLVDYSALSDLDDLDFCRWLTIEHGVAAIPLSPFYSTPPPGQRLARLCFAKHESTLDAAIERLRRI